jgi:acyl-coenzyme A thioesterase PaaI-like protein
MKRINNPWIAIPQYNCFGCCPTNPIGTQMRFFEDGEDIISIWKPTQNHQSWMNTLHGGIQAVLLDEICGWVVFHKLQTAGVTAKMEMRYHKPVTTMQSYIKLRAYLKEMRRNIAIVQGEIWSAADESKGEVPELLCECICTYFTFSQEKAIETMGYVPSTTEEKDYTWDEALQFSTCSAQEGDS